MRFEVDKYKLHILKRDHVPIIGFEFSYSNELQTMLKNQFPKARWSRTLQLWWIRDTARSRTLLGLPERDIFVEDMQARMDTKNAEQFLRYLENLKLYGYSSNTIRTYTNEFAQLLFVLKSFSVNELSAYQLRSYLLYCTDVLKLSENQLHSRLNALKFYFEKVLHQEKFFYDIPRPKKGSLLPKVFSTQEIRRLFDALDNTKHLLMLKLCYGMGLRVSEIVNLKIVDSDRMMVLVACSKNKKDRYVPLPEAVLLDMRLYYTQFKPKVYLFENKDQDKMAIRTVQSIFQQAKQMARIKKKVGIHGLRHSYATHLLEYGTDLSFIQKLLGHQQISTTEIYAKVSNKILSKIQSPLDRL